MRVPQCIVAFLALMVFSTTVLAEEKRWVSSEGTQLKSEASAASESVVDLTVGTEVTVVESGGRWVKVKTLAGKEGWVYAGRITDTQPAAEVSGGDGGVFGESTQKSQINTAKADSARSIRGLSPETDQYAKDRGTPEEYKKALDIVLARKVTPNEIRTFLKFGKIGEYSQNQEGRK